MHNESTIGRVNQQINVNILSPTTFTFYNFEAVFYLIK